MKFKLLCTDLDGTLLGDKEGTLSFFETWKKLDMNNRPLLCYNSGRLIERIIPLIENEIIPKPDYIISGIGTCIYDCKKSLKLEEFSEILEEGWDLQKIENIISAHYDITKQSDHVQHYYKSSWYCENMSIETYIQVKQELEKAGINVNVIYSSSRFLDIIPKRANKGNALKWLAKQLKINTREIIVAGDSGSESAMFQLDEVSGIVVSNSQVELYAITHNNINIYHAQQERSFGLLEGLVHFGIVPKTFHHGKPTLKEKIQREVKLFATKELKDTYKKKKRIIFIRKGFNKAVEALRKNITPLGFSACSIVDNETRGTDVNYKSVWARDGSITIIGSLPLIEDPEIHQCQRITFKTLLDNINPNGQIPTNVSLDGNKPEYAGLGGICSIDSNLWVIIAFYHYIKKKNDIDFLNRYINQLRKMMTWLSAHDANDDGLLEIPEAGDWTDLFGHSYNVLYDEVLWYRANVCFGHLLEILGDNETAGAFIRWSQIIKKAIIDTFWPSTTNLACVKRGNFDSQNMLGDTSYLIAQETPFNFSWRCDVFGNVMASLSDILDQSKSELAFRFMWGVGVNEPYPVKNLYPVVTPGADDWKGYYTVNLLNLPNHYHNGGIWPFIGAHWVRFIYKLGFKELALQELYSLAKLNKKGIFQDWEFNEWFHGQTGRPMGKIYQAWSAAEYIHTCYYLNINNLEISEGDKNDVHRRSSKKD
ncbi:MAG: HAD-IIB family hydrolase [Candidatus Lokiarchaeota archaeon]|nr:HAD-IIB family hydrolase [Candidatus Lokiarchaeota archaeon]